MSVSTLLGAGVIATGTGSAGGVTLSRNAHGLYLRERVTPTYPSSALQTGRRNQLMFMWQRWVSFSAEKQAAWYAYGRQQWRTNAVGNRYNLPGYQAFVAMNFARFMAALPRIENAPAIFKHDVLRRVSANIQALFPRISIVFDESDGWVTDSMGGLIVFCSRGQPSTINWHRSPLRFCGRIQGRSAAPPSSPFALGSGWGFLQPGEHWFGRCYSVRGDGRISPVQWLGPFVVA